MNSRNERLSSDVRITERDKDILKTINAFGYLDIQFISEKYQVKPNVAYRRLRRLKEKKLVRHHFMFHHKPGIYLVTAQGTECCEDDLPPLFKISLGTFDHNLAVSHATLALAKQYQADIITERQIKHRLAKKGVGQNGHIADAALVLNDKKIAIEVELSVKGKERLANILQNYAMQIEYDAVWYICGNKNLFQRFTELSNQYQFIKCFLLQDIVHATN